MGDLTRGKTLPDSADKADFHDLIDDTTIASNKITAAMIQNGVVSEAKLDVTSAPQTNYVMRWDGTKMDWIAQISLLSISDPYTNQDVRTTASPSFVGIIASSLASLAYVESTQVDATYGNFGSLASMANINVVNVNGSTYSSKTMGAWSLMTLSNYLAPSDGFVTTYMTGANGATGALKGYTDNSNPPTTLVAQVGVRDSNANAEEIRSMTFPVKNGDYWGVTLVGSCTASSVRWMPVS